MSNIKNSLLSFSIFLASLAWTHAAVNLTVADNGLGGITMTASGSIDVSSLSYLSDRNFTRANDRNFGTSNFVATAPSTIEETWSHTGDTSFSSSFISYDSINLGSFGNGLALNSSAFFLYDDDGLDNNAAPAASVFNFDFVMTDNDGSTSQYTDGQIIWDSNGFGTLGGETITISVIPEPSYAAFAAMIGLVTWLRKRR